MNRRTLLWGCGLTGCLFLGVALVLTGYGSSRNESSRPTVTPLPLPHDTGPLSLEEALRNRRSVRSFEDRPLSLRHVGQLLWAAQGRTRDYHRTAPSAGALYPLELYVLAGRVTGLPPGLYSYRRTDHELRRHMARDLRGPLAVAAYRQDWIQTAPLVLVIAADYSRTTRKYGTRGRRYVHVEVGHAAQNVYLQATALELGTTVVGAFHDDRVSELLALPSGRAPLALLPLGYPR